MALFKSISLPPFVCMAIAHASESIDADLEDFCPSDSALHPNRAKEHALGRFVAASALLQAGAKEKHLLEKGPQGEPLWPSGFTGSIAHSGKCAVALAATTTHVRALGIDLEAPPAAKRADARPIHPKVAEKVCDASEQAWLKPDFDLRLRMIFSAKESLYKALFPLTQKYFGFHAARLSFNEATSSFTAELLVDLNSQFRAGYCTPIRVYLEQRWVLSLVVIDNTQ